MLCLHNLPFAIINSSRHYFGRCCCWCWVFCFFAFPFPFPLYSNGTPLFVTLLCIHSWRPFAHSSFGQLFLVPFCCFCCCEWMALPSLVQSISIFITMDAASNTFQCESAFFSLSFAENSSYLLVVNVCAENIQLECFRCFVYISHGRIFIFSFDIYLLYIRTFAIRSVSFFPALCIKSLI